MKDKNLKKKKQDAITNQVMLVFVAAAVLLWGVSFICRLLDRAGTYLVGMMTVRIVGIAAAVLALGALVWFLRSRKRGQIREDAVFHPGMAALFFAALALCCGILAYSSVMGMRLIYVLVPCLAILFLVYKVYDRQFFTICVVLGCAAFAMLLCYKYGRGSGLTLLLTAGAALLCLAPVALVLLPEENAVRRALLGKGADKRFLIPLFLVLLAMLAAALLLGGKWALALLLACVAFLIGAAIYFTVKLI